MPGHLHLCQGPHGMRGRCADLGELFSPPELRRFHQDPVRLRDLFDNRISDADQTAVLWMDLDRFKEINDTLGHAVGDLLLMEVGNVLGKPLRDSDTFA
ncbi:hypothetical protein LCGC14_2173990, partial [marine sediment metagenome]